MSWWTYINGTITVEPMGRTQAEKRYILETVLNHLPLVTGSEGDMDVYVIQKNGKNSSCSCDEYGDHTNNLIDSYGGHSFSKGWLRVQDEYILVVDGAFRDREFNDTFREFMKWMCRLSKRVSVKDLLVRIHDYEKSYVLEKHNISGSPYYDMYEWPSWCEESNGEPCWAEHLMWDKAKGSDYPILLAYKYFDDPENDAEVERRREFQNK